MYFILFKSKEKKQIISLLDVDQQFDKSELIRMT